MKSQYSVNLIFIKMVSSYIYQYFRLSCHKILDYFEMCNRKIYQVINFIQTIDEGLQKEDLKKSRTE